MSDGNIYTTNIDGRVKLRTDLDDKIPVRTVPQLLDEAVNLYGENVALSWRQGDEKVWRQLTYEQYQNAVRTCAKAFLKLGLERHHCVCILGFNSPEWFIADLAAIHAGGVATGIYTTNSPEACYHCCSTSKANIVVVEDEGQLAKILEIRDRLPDLKAIIQYSGTYVQRPNIYNWAQIMEMGNAESDNELDTIIKTIAPNECCTLVYTSGTVGNPKAVMLSHDNIIYNATAALKYLGMKCDGHDVTVSYLPLSHVAAQAVEIYASIQMKAHCYFADKNALKGSLVKTLIEVQPTQFLGVPRVWEKIYDKMQEVAAQNGYLKRLLASWAKAQGLSHNQNRINGSPSHTWGYSLANAIVFKRVKQALGFGRCENFISAAAPLSVEIKRYFLSLDICILECFGMSEASGAHTTNTNNAFRLEGIGRTIPGVQSKIHNPDEEGNGEICMMGRHILMGYLNDLEKTMEAIDEDGWLHSGDIGCIDDNGFVHITGRIKELLITAGGENIPPVLIEHMIQAELPVVSNAVLIGDKRKFLSILLSLKSEVDAEGVPLDTLAPETIKWLKSLGCEATTVTQVREQQNAKVITAIQEGINAVNKKAISNAQRIQKFAILPVDFSIATGELGPTLKIKRAVVVKKYFDIIESFYTE